MNTPRTYCAVVTEDLEQVLAHIMAKHPGQPILATGISLGGIILGQYMAKMGSESAVRAAMLVSVPWDIHAGSVSLELPGLNMMLNRHLTRNLCDTVRPYYQDFRSVGIDMDEVLKSRTIREFDERFTTCLFGLDNVDDYYTKATLKFKIPLIKIPVLCVNAADDMFQPFSALPLKEIEQQPNMAMVITSRGGHIGFMEGLVPSAPFFSERLFEQFVTSLVAALKDSSWEAIC
ncbi:ABHD3 [Cordylochernes scorpioides]|uniref:ABHD3 n=1 Tax=Cordylochernes scorpioides TaxID=51811 RepID=A0ABY6JWC5_9ARAC|nr:ABHD3 [Cordylochernes scorpioides]